MPELALRCTVCQALLDEEDLFCANCGTEAPRRDGEQKLATRTSTCNFQCSGCGASMSYDASAGTLRCPFCGSGELEQQADAPAVRPSVVVPFAVSKGDALQAMRRYLSRGFWRPGDLAQRAAVDKMTAVYVPYWVFAAKTHTYWTADTDQVPSGASGDWYPLFGEHRGGHAGVLIGASGALTPAETAALCPFDLSKGVPPEQVDLDNITVESFAVPRKYARSIAQPGLQALEVEVCRREYVPGRSRNVRVNTRVQGLTSEPMLLPVWIMAYRYDDRVFRFLVNGQSGRATGQAPLSWRKIAAAVGIGLLVAAVILAAIALSSR